MAVRLDKNSLISFNKRQLEIADLIETNGSVRVTELSGQFQVSEETIRRDLEKLENEGILKRVHGGGVLNKPRNSFEIPVTLRSQTNVQEKKAVALKAASFVEDGDIIAIDASTTGLELAKYIRGKSVTVITNSIPVTLELLEEPQIQVILIGGYLAPKSISLVGNFAERVITDYHVDKYFFSCSGLDFKRGISEIDEAQALVKKQIISISEQLFLLADNGKFGQNSLFRFCELKDISYLIIDNKVPIGMVKELNNMGIRVKVGKNIEE